MRQEVVMTEKIFLEKGFERLENGSYKKYIKEVLLIAEISAQKLVLSAHCASVVVDNEGEIEKYAVAAAQRYSGIAPAFRERLLTIDILPAVSVREERLLDDALELAADVIEHFDMLPVCMSCGRVMAVELIYIDGAPFQICGVCKGERDLSKAREDLLKAQQERYENEYGPMGVQKRPIRAAIKAGFLGGLYTCIFGALYMSFMWVFLGSFVHLFFGFMGAIAGFFTIRRVNQISHIPVWQKLALSTASAFVTLFVLSGITFLVLNPLIYHGKFLEMFQMRIYDLGSPVMYMAVLGMGSFFLSEWIFGFIFPGRK